MINKKAVEEKVNPQFWVLGDLQGNVFYIKRGSDFTPEVFPYYAYAKNAFDLIDEGLKAHACIYGIRCTLKPDGKPRIKDLNWYLIPEGEVLPLDVKAKVIKWFNEYIQKGNP
jgi:hypothetical protein